MLSKKHYIEIAKILKTANYSTRDYCGMTAGEVVSDLIDGLVGYFEQDNPAFNKEKFIKTIYGEKK